MPFKIGGHHEHIAYLAKKKRFSFRPIKIRHIKPNHINLPIEELESAAHLFGKIMLLIDNLRALFPTHNPNQRWAYDDDKKHRQEA